MTFHLRIPHAALGVFAAALVLPYSCQAQVAEESNHTVTVERVNQLPAAQRQPWLDYIKRSDATLKADQAFLAAEVKAAGLKEAIPAPYPLPGQPRVPEGVSADWYSSSDGKAYLEAVLSFQMPNGGWSKNLGFNAGNRKPGQTWTTSNEGWYYLGTFDNGATIGPMMALAKGFQATKDPRFAASFIRGLDYIFKAQFPNGGWPQNYPLAGWYHDEVTFNDDAMTRVVGLLRDVASAKPEYSFVDPARREKATAAEKAGLACILKCQIVQNGQLTAWCAQHDPLTLDAAPARKFELRSISGWESAGIVTFLMGYENPSPELQKAIEGAVSWFKSTKITGYEIVSGKNAAGGVTFALRANPEAAPIWGRFYEIGTNRPIFSDRQSNVYYSLAELDQSGPGRGYHWYVTQPGKLLERDYPRWKATWFNADGSPKVQSEGELLVRSASLSGGRATLENGGDNIGFWDSTETRITWQKDLKPGQYKVALEYSLDKKQAGSEIEVQVGQQRLKVKPVPTSGWSDYQSIPVGVVTLDKAGTTDVQVRALSKPREFVANLRGVSLTLTQ